MVQIFFDYQLPDVFLSQGWDPVGFRKRSFLLTHTLSVVRGLSRLSPAANQTAREYYNIQLRGFTDSASGPVVNPEMPTSSLAKTAAGDRIDLLVAPARCALENIIQLSEQFFCVVESHVNDFGVA